MHERGAMHSVLGKSIYYCQDGTGQVVCGMVQQTCGPRTNPIGGVCPFSCHGFRSLPTTNIHRGCSQQPHTTDIKWLPQGGMSHTVLLMRDTNSLHPPTNISWPVAKVGTSDE